MAYIVSKVPMWIGRIKDRVGGLAEKLDALADAGADLELVIARRQRHMPGEGVVFLGPVTGAKVQKAAKSVGLARARDLVALRVEGTNRPGEGRRLTQLLASAGLNLRGLAASVMGKKFVAFLAFDTEADASKAVRLLRVK
jgi:hypothetical protein